jgi:hypothetical protein
MNEVLGFGKGASAGQFIRFLGGTKISSHVGAELTMKLENPFIFQGVSAGPNLPPSPIVHGYDVTILIDICKAIIEAESAGQLLARQANIARQAHLIVGASAKAGIKGLAYALAGYNPSAQEVIDAFKLYVMCLSLPALSRRLLGNLRSPFWRHAFGARFPALQAAESTAWYRSRVFALFLGRRLAVHDLPAGDIDNELGGLAKISWAFGVFAGHNVSMGRALSFFQSGF